MSAEKSLLTEKPRGVEISLIERELTRLWEERSEDQEARGAPPVIRACSMNLLVVTDDGSRASLLGEMLGDVSVSLPSRMFLVALETCEEESSLDAWISARCSLPIPGQSQVCSEEITLRASGSGREKVSGIVTSLLVPDLPTVVIWKSDAAPEESGIGALLPFVDRLIIDSSDLQHPERILLSWGERMRPEENRKEQAAGIAFRFSSETLTGDLSWTCLTPWRSLLARVFQPLELRRILAETSDLLLEFSSTSSPLRSGLAQAYLLSAWLADRLDWDDRNPFRPDPSGGLEASVQPRSQEGPLTLRVSRVQSTAPYGSLESVTFRGSGDGMVRLQATARRDCFMVQRSARGLHSEEFLHHPALQDEALLLARELEVFQREPSYERAVARLSRLLVEQD